MARNSSQSSSQATLQSDASSDTGASAGSTDKVEGEVTRANAPQANMDINDPQTTQKGTGQVPPPPATSDTTTHLGVPLAQITTPEAAISALKARTGILHTIVHNASHVGTLAFNDIEQLIADIKWLTTFTRSKA